MMSSIAMAPPVRVVKADLEGHEDRSTLARNAPSPVTGLSPSLSSTAPTTPTNTTGEAWSPQRLLSRCFVTGTTDV
jgi:hypothetical protein